jgi:uncharacterized membrane protein YgdD (TMEM256/DUF423 family)
MHNKMIFTGAVFCGIAVILGAFGAHALKAMLTPESLQSFQTGVQYQMLHGLAIILVAIVYERTQKAILAKVFTLFAAGIIAFSGSIYMLTFFKYKLIEVPALIALITPIGGLLMIIGWFSLAWTFLRK